MENLLAKDLDHVLTHTEGLWEDLRGQRIFITGGTGFFGSWLLESFARANEKLKLNATAVVLTRDFDAFREKAPHLASKYSIQFHVGDVRSFNFPEGEFSYIIHAATEAGSQLYGENPLLMIDTIVEGTRHTLEFARHCGTPRFLFTSSGSVYGKQPPEMTHIPENYVGAPDPMQPCSAYGEGKRLAELLCAIYAQQYGVQIKIARCFAFVGPQMPLDKNFAIGNFIRDGLCGGPIHINGDGTPYRSYLYAADLVIWLWTILFKGVCCHPYNVGSDKPISILDLAQEVVSSIGMPVEIVVAEKPILGQQPVRYVPNIFRARNELNTTSWTSLREAIRRTADWIRNQK